MLHYLLAVCTLLFTAAGSAKVEVNDQQIQTEIVETEHKSVQVGSTTKQQGAYVTVRWIWIHKRFLAGLVIFGCYVGIASK